GIAPAALRPRAEVEAAGIVGARLLRRLAPGPPGRAASRAGGAPPVRQARAARSGSSRAARVDPGTGTSSRRVVLERETPASGM
ncbi:hypothetical protein, partial [Anaeromyxobacter sp. SG17]|uniref:hypothetical protein n=1 Tax=Anaeromyxobacter sp. SG17 TaxID=2925405 RepID=UPI001F589FD6